MRKAQVLVISPKRAIDNALSSAQISRRFIADSYRKHPNIPKPMKRAELTSTIELWKERMALNAGKYLVVATMYGATAAAWFALKS